MDFGLDEFDDVAVDESRAPARELLPEGEHDLQIRGVGWLEDGRLEIRLAPDERNYGWVFAKFPKDADWAKRILSGLRKACGMSREEWAATDMTDLVGRRVRTRVYHKAGSKGGTFVNVGEFLVGEAAEPKVERAVAPQAPAVERAVAPPAARPTPPRRTPTQKADAAAAMPDDDLPF